MIGGLERADRSAEYLAHPLIFHFVEIFHVEYHPLLFRESGNGFAELFGKFVAIYPLVGLDKIGKMRFLIVDADIEPLAFFGKESDAFVNGYLIEPCGSLASPRKFSIDCHAFIKVF